MRPLSLVMEGFGPYASRQELDFRALGARCLLLIHGPTGAGKTTILDAITYALYGKSSGNERVADDVRSHFAGTDAPTQVTLEFALGERRYRVRREPAYERTAKRRSGTAQNAADATLWRTDGEAEAVLETGVDRVSQKVGELLGLTVQQFRQVIVLPQGRFRELLTADVPEREDILCRLFPTGIYQLVQDDLARQLADAERELGDSMVRQRSILEREQVADPDALEAKIAGLQAGLLPLDEEKARLETAKNELDARLLKASRDKDALDLVRRLDSERLELDGQAGAHERRRAELDAARKSAQVLDQLAPVEAAQRGAAAAADAVARAGEQVRQMRARREEAAELCAAHEARAPERDRAVARGAELGRHQEAAGALERARAQAARLAPLKDAARARLEEAQADGEAAARQLVKAEQAVAVARTLAAQADGLASALRLAQKQLEDREKLAKAAGDAAQARAGHATAAAAMRDAVAALAAAQEAHDRLQKLWIEGQAGRLARTLEPGEPCPVCGGREHPEPARAVDGAPATEELDRAASALTGKRAAADRARDAAAKADAVSGERHAALERLERELGEGAARPVEALEEEAAAARRKLAEAGRARDALPELQEACSAAHVKIEVLGRSILRAREDEHAAFAAHQAAAAVEEQLRAALPEELRPPGAIGRELERAARLVREFDEAKQALAARVAQTAQAAHEAERELARQSEAQRTAQETLEEARAAYERARAAAGFADERAFREAVRPRDAVAALEAAIARHEGRVRSLADQLAAAREAARDLTEPDLDALRAQCALALARYGDACNEVATAQANLTARKGSLAEYRAAAAELARIQSRSAVVRKVAHLVCGTGDAAIKLTLQRYVLGAYLDRVLERATYRLVKMTHGRFVIRRRAEPGDKRRAEGLNLEIVDEHTGRPRPAHTLSGGESFLAALALALGLSDEVEARTGGHRLDTIFVDEGFGSLDEDALDEAIKTLAELQQGGRLVGIISHVPQLRERIDTRLEVKASTHGSEARLVAP